MNFQKRQNAHPWSGQLVDAHRHGLYDIQLGWSLAGVPVERWDGDPRFIEHERWTKQLHGVALYDALLPWLNYSREEGIGTVLDFSGKHARAEVAEAQAKVGLKSASPVLWDAWTPDLEPRPLALILPDERQLNEAAAEVARKFLKASSDGFITLHAAESLTRTQIGMTRIGGSIVAWLAREELLTPRTLLVHVNVLTSEDFGLIAEAGAGVVLCPAVRAALGNPTPSLPRQIHVHFGTDSPLVSGERSLVAQAKLEMAHWALSIGRVKASERAAQALLRPLFGSTLPAPHTIEALAEFLLH